MTVKLSSYGDVREHILPGDIIAFGGKGLFSRWAKLTTSSSVSHVAMVVRTQIFDSNSPHFFNKLFEATRFIGDVGVHTSRLSYKVLSEKGDIWWLPLSQEKRALLQQNYASLIAFLLEQDGKPYDISQLYGAATDFWDRHPRLRRFTFNRFNGNKWFCSELVAQALNTTGITDNVNPSEVTPIDICQFNLYADTYVQIKGRHKEIEGFNTKPSLNFGQLV